MCRILRIVSRETRKSSCNEDPRRAVPVANFIRTVLCFPELHLAFAQVAGRYFVAPVKGVNKSNDEIWGVERKFLLAVIKLFVEIFHIGQVPHFQITESICRLMIAFVFAEQSVCVSIRTNILKMYQWATALF